MRYFYLVIKSFKCFVRQEKFLALWSFLGIMLASAMLLICTGSYFERYTDIEYEKFVHNRYDFIFENSFDKVLMLGDRLISDDRAENVRLLVSFDSGLVLESWLLPQKAYIRLEAGKIPDDCSKDDWCIISDEYQWKKDALEDNTPNINDNLEVNGKSYRCVGIEPSNDYDMLISINALKEILETEGSSGDLSRAQITYVYDNEATTAELEKLNGAIINEYKPDAVVRGKKFETYSFAEFLKETASITLLALFAIVNYILVYDYWIKKRLYTYQIYRICGLTLSDTLKMILLEQVLSLLLVHLIVSMTYTAVLHIVSFERVLEFSVSVLQSLFTGAVLLILSLAVFLVVGRNMILKSLMSAYTEGEQL